MLRCTETLIIKYSKLMVYLLYRSSAGTRQKNLSCAAAAAAAAKSPQSCPTLCDPIDGSPPGSPVPGILQAGELEWGAIAFSALMCYWSSIDESNFHSLSVHFCRLNHHQFYEFLSEYMMSDSPYQRAVKWLSSSKIHCNFLSSKLILSIFLKNHR